MKKLTQNKETNGIEATDSISQNTRTSKVQTFSKIFSQTENSRQSSDIGALPA